MKKSISPKRLKRIALILAAVLILAPIVGFFHSIDYNVSYLLRFLLYDHVQFKEHEEEFELLTEQMYLFVDSRPDFFEEFHGNFFFTEDGIKFSRERHEAAYFHPVEAEGWADAYHNYQDAFPEWAKPGPGERVDRIFPNYIVFSSTLVYTRDGKYPREYINHLKSVGHSPPIVIKYAKGWYEVFWR